MLLKNDKEIIRVLKEQGDRVLIIDCIKRTMPKWVSQDAVSTYIPCSEEELYDQTGRIQNRLLTQQEQRIAQEHFTMIAGVLPFIGNEAKRNHMIELLSEQQSKQTIRKYLCLYLVYQDLSVLAPRRKSEKKELTQDEKNMRWALNKFFYTKNKSSLADAYTMLLKEKYCDAQGQLLGEYPSIHQFRYFYRKTRKMQQYYISRDGIKAYQRNNRPLLGDGVQQFAPNVGVGMLDSTVCDIYLVDDGGKLVGRPMLTACIDAFSGMCCGYSLGWESGTYSLRSLMRNVIADKVQWCRSHGVFIEEGEWDCSQMPGILVTDMGSEYKGDTFSQITELGVKIQNLPPYRPELKGPVEKFFDVLQKLYIKHYQIYKTVDGVSAAYFTITLLASLFFMTAGRELHKFCLVIHVVITGIYVAAILVNMIANAHTSESIVRHEAETAYIKQSSIMIYEPTNYKRILKEKILDADGNPTKDENGRFVTREVERTFPNFKVGYVFAYEDTSGKPLPSIVSILDKEVENYDVLMKALQTVSPVPIRFAPVPGTANGFYDLEKREICVDSTLPQLQKVKTSIHEIAHGFLHDKVTGEDPTATQREMEVSAESVAFVVCSYLGLDTSDYSFGYVGGWSAGKELKELQQKMEVIRKTANTIISGIEAELMKNTVSESESQQQKTTIPEITVTVVQQEKSPHSISHRRR